MLVMNKKEKSFFEQEVDRLQREDPLRAEHYAHVRQSKAFMAKNYSEKIALDDLAKAAFMSKFHFVRMFQRMYGVTPRIYLRDIRIAKAKELLVKGLPITQVGLSVGYQSLPSFSSTFKKCTSLSPREFQQLHKSNLE